MRIRKMAIAVGLWAGLAGAGLAQAGDEPAPNIGRLSFSGGVDVVSEYFFRGYLQEDRGLILQPYFQMNLKLHESDTLTISPFVGLWNSLHEERTGAGGSGPGWWFEADFYVGVDFVLGDFTITPIFTAYTYPNGAFDTILELGVQVSYDDSALLRRLGIPFALNPHIAAYWEIDDDNPGASRDAYLEVGITPGFEFKAGNLPVAVSFPIVLGMSLDDYYFDADGDETFWGYGSAGIAASVPLPIPARYGTWSLTGSLTYLHLFADSAQAANRGDDDEWIWKVGIGFSY
jgi:hypothetical protein